MSCREKNPPKNTGATLNRATLASNFANEEAAREFLEKERWPNGPVCLRCSRKKVYTLKDSMLQHPYAVIVLGVGAMEATPIELAQRGR